jgi:hypothetical protein
MAQRTRHRSKPRPASEGAPGTLRPTFRRVMPWRPAPATRPRHVAGWATVGYLAAMLCAADAAAQGAPRWDVTPAVGIAHTLNAGVSDDVTSAMSVSIGVRTWPRIVAEGELLRLNNVGPNAASRQAYWFGGNVLVHLRDSGWRPFGLVGFGLGRVVVKDQDISGILHIPGGVTTDRAFNVGGGVVVPIARRVALRTDFRWLTISDGYDDLYNVARATAGIALGF